MAWHRVGMDSPTFAPPWSRDGAKLFTLGFLTLFLELALIRYLAGSIWNLGYFPNLVLVAVFIGMGLGFMLHHIVPPRLSPVLFQGAMLALLALIVGVYIWHPTMPGFTTWSADFGGDLYFTATPKAASRQSYSPFVLCVAAIVVVFALVSQRSAKLFRTFRPLTAYTLDIAGSCTGIVGFMIISWLGIPAWMWFALFSLIFVLAMSDSWKTRLLPLVPAAVMVLLVRHQDTSLMFDAQYRGPLEVEWSPYQKLEYRGDIQFIYANGVGHQRAHPQERMRSMFYQAAFRDRAAHPELGPYRSALILGAGCGNDVAVALSNGVTHIDAVEIDPAIAQFGKRHHPERPYDDRAVNVVIDDGRAFMNRTTRRYDLVVFALTDSLVKVSSMSQLRLENYLFTEESVRRAYELLAPGGDLVFYNHYRQPWLRDKIQELIRRATGQEPRVLREERDLAVISARKANGRAVTPTLAGVEVPTDDWPFLYVARRGIPRVYGWAMGLMGAFVLLLATLMHWVTRRKGDYGGRGMLPLKLAFVFMGIAFLLLETKSVIQFSLLFGTTWLNNSLVFLGVLLLVLAANWTALLIRDPRWLWLVFALLITSSLGTFVYPLGRLLDVESMTLRFILASLLTFSPVFFANLVFSVTFRDIAVPEHIFGWNLIGSTVGGIAEYASMLLGYSSLGVIVAVCYSLVVILIVLSRRRAEMARAPAPSLAA